MFNDIDIKIAGDKPSRDIKTAVDTKEDKKYSDDIIQNAKELGRIIALKYAKDVQLSAISDEQDDLEMAAQRRLLLSFTATVGFEKYCADDLLCGKAQKSFLDTLNKTSTELYASSGDTGAFSFYYLAYRRGGDTERRIGQTFAMLCSHDGDPVYQELGEALYCWFLSVIEMEAGKLGFTK